ncbi:hypothetical protein CASFOL_022217 [Castilleja foliolosa]|uniref:Uncharacterized protein n=1 Tax=Castilleja foliolosa TaxID=1961234 RepID=A0ABD3CU12_9LAMI
MKSIPNYIPTDPNFLHTAVRGVNVTGSEIGTGIGMPDMFPSSNCLMTKQLELPSTGFWDSSTSPGIGMGMLDMFPSTNFPMTNQLELPSTCSWDSPTTPGTGMGMPDIFPSTNFPVTNQLDIPSASSWDSSTTPGTGTGVPDMFSPSNYPMTNQLELPGASYLDSSTSPGISTFSILPDISDAGLYGIQNVRIGDVFEQFALTTSCPISSSPHEMRELSPTHVINQLGKGKFLYSERFKSKRYPVKPLPVILPANLEATSRPSIERDTRLLRD